MFKKLREKIDMYDMIIANIIAGKSIIEPSAKLDNSQLHIGFSNISSNDQITKYFVINRLPDYIKPNFMDEIRIRCMSNLSGVKINFFFSCTPHKINWDSPEMKNRMNVWSQYSKNVETSIDVFDYRSKRGDALNRERMLKSTMYLNEAELDYKRSFLKVAMFIEVSGKRDEESLANMAEAIRLLRDCCNKSEIKLNEIRGNMIDWLRSIDPFCMVFNKTVNSKIARTILTDDLLANFCSYRQGRIGDSGIPLGIDILSYVPVLHIFKEDPSAAENWLISAGTGGGKSLYVKVLLTYLLALNFTICVMDYEGDEYNNLANFVRDGNPDDVKVVSMGKNSATYFDPCEIPTLTGDNDVDCELKESAISFILAMFRVIVHGVDGVFSTEEEKIMSIAIQRMYDSAGVTEDRSTWHRSRGLNIRYVYENIKDMYENKELVEPESDNLKHKAAGKIIDAASIYFETGESKANTFNHPMSANELYRAKLIIFSFGMKGASSDASDPALLALKQLSVAYVNISISNNTKYVKHFFNVKVWEEFQRYGDIKGSAATISNSITGGRKRGDVNFIITNDLNAMLDENNELSNKILSNIQYFAIGRIKDDIVRERFCTRCDLPEIKPALDQIAKASTKKASKYSGKKSSNQSNYKNSFCVVLDTGEKAIVKAMLPSVLLESDLFATGVAVKQEEEEDEES